ncbi:hypothetical protein [Celeribacter sp.]|uniref:hypothetical protein n=1 Tax=Celeribacter sp. TaxID=1890673 RepID=UPI003A8F2B2F
MFSIFDGFDANCCLLTASHILARTLPAMLEDNDVTVRVCTDHAALWAALANDTTVTHAFIDIDSFSGIAAQFDSIRHLRDSHPGLSIILLSDDFSMNEFGTHRLMLADVSLRIPVTIASLELALLQAPVNNAQWRNRADPVHASYVPLETAHNAA